MPLHDWTDRQGWEGVYFLWIVELLRWIKSRLPADYRVYIRSAPTESVGMSEPEEEVGAAVTDLRKALYVERQGRLAAAVELVSPRNKDRPVARATYLARYVSYLLEGVHLLLVDVHRRPLAFSFADQIAHQLQITQPPLPAPLAAGYRVGEPAATGGRFLAVWRRPLTPGAALPVMALPLDVETSVPVDLEQTYARAAADAYLG